MMRMYRDDLMSLTKCPFTAVMRAWLNTRGSILIWRTGVLISTDRLRKIVATLDTDGARVDQTDSVKA